MFIKLKSLIPNSLKIFIKKFYSFNGYLGLDKKMLEFINYKRGFYIECGANDGVNQSNTWYFEKKLDWHGILIEPQPNIFLKLKNNRSKKNFFENCALKSAKTNKNLITMHIDPSDTLISRSTKTSNRFTNKIEVIAKTLNSILIKNNAPKEIDFFSIDVEGDELNILNGINFKRYVFSYILIETLIFKQVNKFLKKKKYSFIKKLSGGDYLFKKN
jgi:FkbM family methyltransferase